MKIERMRFLVAVVVFLVCGFSGMAAAPEFQEAVKKAAANSHPMLFANEVEFAAVRAKLDGQCLRSFAAQRVRERADALLDVPPLERVLIGRRMLSVSRKALYRISTLAMAYRLYGDDNYFKRAEKELLAVCGFSDWNADTHFLDTGEMSLAVAIGYDWLYDRLSPESREFILRGLEKNGLDAGLRDNWWKKLYNNWSQVCRAGLVATSLMLAERRPEDCVRMLEESITEVPKSIKAYAPDGCYPEGPGYWHYGTSFNVFLVAELESALGKDFGLAELPGFWKTAEYPNAVTAPSGITMAYSDCGGRRGAMQVLWWFAKKLGRPDLITDFEIDAMVAPVTSKEGWLPPLEILWMDDRKDGIIKSRLPNLWQADGVCPIVAMRAGDVSNAFAGIKGGSPVANHGHMDGGNFVLEMGGVRWAHELPHEEYNRIEQMKINLWAREQESGRWSLFRLNTHGHNVPEIDGGQQQVKGFAKLKAEETDDILKAQADISSLYPRADRAIRTYELEKTGKKFKICDRFEKVKAAAGADKSVITWKMVTKATAQADGNKLVLREDGKTMIMFCNGETWKVSPAKGESAADSPNPVHRVVSFSKQVKDGETCELEVAFELVSDIESVGKLSSRTTKRSERR